MFKIKFALCLPLFAAFVLASCENDKSYEPITLSFADGSGYLTTEMIGMMLPEHFPPLIIDGGDGHYTITNNSAEYIDYELVGLILTIKSVAAGRGSISISDRSDNVYELKIHVIETQVPGMGKLYTYPLIKTDGMDPSRKIKLERKIVEDAPKGAWDFGTTYLKEGMVTTAKRFLTNTEDSEYLEYICTVKGKAPIGHRSFMVYTQIVIWLVMKSDTEEFILFLCQPFVEDGKIMRGYNLIIDVTDRYLDDYPEITRAYEIQTGYSQPDWE